MGMHRRAPKEGMREDDGDRKKGDDDGYTPDTLPWPQPMRLAPDAPMNAHEDGEWLPNPEPQKWKPSLHTIEETEKEHEDVFFADIPDLADSDSEDVEDPILSGRNQIGGSS